MVINVEACYLRKRDRDSKVIKGNVLILQFVFDIDIASAIIRWRWPAIDFRIKVNDYQESNGISYVLERGM